MICPQCAKKLPLAICSFEHDLEPLAEVAADSWVYYHTDLLANRALPLTPTATDHSRKLKLGGARCGAC